MSLIDNTLFLREAFFNPRKVGSIIPSSNGLARAMAEWLPADDDSLVIELGPGTGKVTRALLDTGLDPDRLVAIEYSQRLTHLMRRRFPGVRVINDDAFELDRIARDQLPQDRPITTVISSLPLRNFGTDMARRLCQTISSIVQPGGVVVQYSYHIHQGQLACMDQLTHHRSRIIWRNLPPARLYVYGTEAPQVMDEEPTMNAFAESPVSSS